MILNTHWTYAVLVKPRFCGKSQCVCSPRSFAAICPRTPTNGSKQANSTHCKLTSAFIASRFKSFQLIAEAEVFGRWMRSKMPWSSGGMTMRKHFRLFTSSIVRRWNICSLPIGTFCCTSIWHWQSFLPQLQNRGSLPVFLFHAWRFQDGSRELHTSATVVAVSFVEWI